MVSMIQGTAKVIRPLTGAFLYGWLGSLQTTPIAKPKDEYQTNIGNFGKILKKVLNNFIILHIGTGN